MRSVPNHEIITVGELKVRRASSCDLPLCSHEITPRW
jgi:hypothetical protein